MFAGIGPDNLFSDRYNSFKFDKQPIRSGINPVSIAIG